MKITTEPDESIVSQARSKLPDFLLAEYVHMCESLLRNEELGEKRSAFFVTLVGAAGGILGFVFGENTPIVSREHMPIVAAVVAAVLLFLGILTMRRLVERDMVTDRFIFALRTLRRLFLTEEDAAVVANAFFDPYGRPRRRSVKVFSVEKGGWLRTVAFVNALLTAIVVAAVAVSSNLRLPVSLNLAPTWQIAIAFALAFAAGVLVWRWQLTYAGSTIISNQKKLEEKENLAPR